MRFISRFRVSRSLRCGVRPQVALDALAEGLDGRAGAVAQVREGRGEVRVHVPREHRRHRIVLKQHLQRHVAHDVVVTHMACEGVWGVSGNAAGCRHRVEFIVLVVAGGGGGLSAALVSPRQCTAQR